MGFPNTFREYCAEALEDASPAEGLTEDPKNLPFTELTKLFAIMNDQLMALKRTDAEMISEVLGTEGDKELEGMTADHVEVAFRDLVFNLAYCPR